MLIKAIISLNGANVCEVLERSKFSDYNIIDNTGHDLGINFVNTIKQFEKLQEKYGLDNYLDELDNGKDDNKILREVFEFEEIKKVSYMLVDEATKEIKKRMEFWENINSDDYTDVNS